MSEAKKGKINPFFGKTHSEETKQKMIGNCNSKNQPTALKIEVTDLKLNTKTAYSSINEAARALEIYPKIISQYFTRNQIKPFRGRYTFKKL